MADDQIFYIGQKALIEKDGNVLILNKPLVGADLPGGKIQVGELDFVKALEREVMEETGLTISVKEPISTGYFKIHYPKTNKKSDYVFILAYNVDYVAGNVVLSDEHDAYQWVSKENYQMIDDKRGIIKNILTKYFENK